MRRLLPVTVICCILLSLLAGCSSRDHRWDALYSQLSEDPWSLDKSVLAGRRIVIDPGHGGYFRGATGIDSLAESDANLGVALYLWGMLDEAGADVSLTRSTDRDFIPGASLNDDAADPADAQDLLRGDLSARVEIANSHDPEVFLSIHHNSHISRDRDRNRIEIYYRSGDPAASLELAEEIHIHLARNLGIDEAVIKPGNYYVLRNSQAGASVLGEASYISNPNVEEKLRISTRQRLEAEAYFLGLLSYFARGVPRIEYIVPESDTLLLPASVDFRIGKGAGIPLDPASIKVRMDGKEIPSAWDAKSSTLTCPLPDGIPNGRYSLRAGARSIRGASSNSPDVRVTVDRPVRYFLPLIPERIAGGSVKMSVQLMDETGGKVLDGKRVTATTLDGSSVSHGISRSGEFVFEIPSRHADSPFILSADGSVDTLSFDPTSKGMPILVVDSTSGRPIAGSLLVIPGAGSVPADRGGSIEIPSILFEMGATLHARGYRPLPVTADDIETFSRQPVARMIPLLGGLMHGKRISIDPSGGGSDGFGRGPDLLRGSTVNMEIAKRVSIILSATGARVSLTRDGEETVSVYERIDRVNRFSPHIALGLRFGSTSVEQNGLVSLHHYPGSSGGTRAAGSLAETICSIPPCLETETVESSALFLQQTSCPACEIHAPLVEFTEALFRNPAWLDMEASLIVKALVDYFNDAGEPCFAHTFRLYSGTAPVEGALVSIDGVFSMVTGSDGSARFWCVGPGRHIVTVSPAGSGPDRVFDIVVGPEEDGESALRLDSAAP